MMSSLRPDTPSYTIQHLKEEGKIRVTIEGENEGITDIWEGGTRALIFMLMKRIMPGTNLAIRKVKKGDRT